VGNACVRASVYIFFHQQYDWHLTWSYLWTSQKCQSGISKLWTAFVLGTAGFWRPGIKESRMYDAQAVVMVSWTAERSIEACTKRCFRRHLMRWGNNHRDMALIRNFLLIIARFARRGDRGPKKITKARGNIVIRNYNSQDGWRLHVAKCQEDSAFAVLQLASRIWPVVSCWFHSLGQLLAYSDPRKARHLSSLFSAIKITGKIRQLLSKQFFFIIYSHKNLKLRFQISSLTQLWTQ
jgi:hypothetical protein